MIRIYQRFFLKGGPLLLLLVFVGGCALGPRLDLSDPQTRAKAVDAYLAEFSSSAFEGTLVGKAIRDVMMRLPPDALAIVMDRRRPVLFTENYDVGTARFASSAEIIVTEKDVPAFHEGMTIIKLSTALERGTPEAAMGIVAHELAHRVLDHVRRGHVSCQAEREANHLIKSWGFVTEYEAASTEFGREKTGDNVASCQE